MNKNENKVKNKNPELEVQNPFIMDDIEGGAKLSFLLLVQSPFKFKLDRSKSKPNFGSDRKTYKQTDGQTH